MKAQNHETVAASPHTPRVRAWSGWLDLPRPQRRRIGWLVGYLSLLSLLFLQPLIGLMRLAGENELHSHIPLVPLIAGYLLYTRRSPAATPYDTSIGGALLMGGLGLATIAGAGWWRDSLSVNDYHALMALAFVSLVAAGGFLFLGFAWMRAAAFPVSFLIFMIPLPDTAVFWLERGSQLASADVAAMMIDLTGTPLLREGTVFRLPGIVLEVARECSGIRSSWVLFITGVLASHLFLKDPWRRIVLVVFVIPLGIVRNGFRVLVIAMLCVHVGPHMIDSFIHHQGGPIFFVLSLAPLFALSWWLRRGDRRVNLPD